MNSNDGRNRSKLKCCGKYHEEKFENKRFLSLSDEDFQKVIKERNFKHDHGHKRYSSRV